MREDFENKCSTCTACISSSKNSGHQLQLTEKIKLPVMTELTNIVRDDNSYLCDSTKINFSVPLKHIPIYMARNEKEKVTGHIVMARKTKLLCWSSHKSPRKRLVKPVSGDFQHPYKVFEKKNQKKNAGGET